MFNVTEYQKCQNDVVYFIENCIKVNTPKGIIPFKMYDCQKELIELYNNNKFVVSKWCKQSGKTLTFVGYLLHNVLFNRNKIINIVVNGGLVAESIFSLIIQIYKQLPDFFHENSQCIKNIIRFQNGSGIIISTDFDVDFVLEEVSLLIIDEFSLSDHNKADTFMQFIDNVDFYFDGDIPKIFVTSTPNGVRDRKGKINRFYELYMNAVFNRNLFVSHENNWKDIFGADGNFKSKMNKYIGKREWQQEFEGQFLWQR